MLLCFWNARPHHSNPIQIRPCARLSVCPMQILMWSSISCCLEIITTSYRSACLREIPVCQGLTLFPFLFWAEIAKPTVSSLPPFSQPLSRCVSFTDRLIEFDFLWSRGLACSLTCTLLFSLALHPSHPQHLPQPVLY